MLDTLDVALLRALREHPRAGVLELARVTGVARATVATRMQRWDDEGVVTGYGPDLDLPAAGYPVQAFVTIEIAQGGLDAAAADLAAIPGIVEAHATTGSGDVLARIAATSHDDLQQILLQVSRSGVVTRTTSVVVLSTVVPYRTLPLLEATDRPTSTRAPAYRE
ncbi:Lrp/AsnC family transcriptional regulator [Jatrophihabitans sp. YIM 134969]